MNDEIHLKLMKLLEKNPELTQRELSVALGVSLGKVNYCLRALKDKGWVKWTNFSNNPNKIQYAHLLTPTGLAEKVALTVRFLKRKEEEYKNLRREIKTLKQEVSKLDRDMEELRV
jgi:EPS-associated MarR family transcriptional regulator